tara:strand:- start:145 stop:318 length:174 start_codon:yes stop_codon:yes gene_type:complete
MKKVKKRKKNMILMRERVMENIITKIKIKTKTIIKKVKIQINLLFNNNHHKRNKIKI